MIIPYRKLIKPRLGSRPYKGHRLSRGLVGLWLMNENGGSSVFDLSGNEITGTKGGAVVWEAGKFGSSNHYDGSSGYHDMGDPAQLELITSDFTFVMWVKLDAAPGTWWAFGGRWSDTADNRSYLLGCGEGAYDGFIFFTEYPPTPSLGIAQSTTTASSRVGIWTQVVGVRKGTVTDIYVDGIWEGTDTTGASLSTYNSNFFLGKHTDGWFDGSIDHALIYNRALSASEVALLHRYPFWMFKDPAEIALLGGYQAVVGAAGIMTTNTGYWGPTF